MINGISKQLSNALSKITVDICVLDRVPSKKKMSGMPGSDVIYSIMRISDIIG